MLKFIHIRNFALAEDLQIEFQPGLNILTGETGAGKSILVGAIAAVLGERVYTEVIRTGCDRAFVEAVVDVSNLATVRDLLETKGIPAAEELFLRREIPLKGNSRAFINDVPVTVTTLKEVGDLLVDIHGQHEHQSLLRRETHRRLLDAFGQLAPLLEAVAAAYHRVKDCETALKELQQRQQELTEKYDLYEFQYQEIEKAGLTPGEDAALEQERRLLANAEKLFELSAELTRLFGEDEFNLLDAVGEADHRLRELAQFDPEMHKLYEEFTGARIVMEETSRAIEEFQARLEFDPRRLEEVEARLSLIGQLKKKYGPTIEDILRYQEQIKEALNLKENYQFEIERLKQEYNQAVQAYTEQAQRLSAARRQAGDVLEQKVQTLLNELGMPRTRFQVSLQREENAQGIFRQNGRRFRGDATGVDQVEFFISPNPGEDFKPLNKIASGGEISRIMLALKSILAENDAVPTLIFDEIDSGVSGRIAQAVGRAIRQLSRSHQVLCITHLPQIASQGDVHFTVEKYVEDGRTYTRIFPLSEEQRVEAIARLMAGERISETVMESARQLIEESRSG
ncbi:MAG: DNA repair protein RecN [Calditrichaeota bacterium]|nr:MAG: DNA repair protein RecN [Calditrichota bacterium]